MTVARTRRLRVQPCRESKRRCGITICCGVNPEFQTRMKAVMSRYGDFKEGPVKAVERCQSKLENEYQEAAYPKAAKLLDVVRCSVSFNTVEQLLTGYKGLMGHIETTSASLELARVKNGFLGKGASYRDIKVNVVYHSETDPEHEASIICEVQLILNQYLHEKKRIHKLYDILRERTFFEMVVKQEADAKDEAKDIKLLQFEPVLNVRKEVTLSYTGSSYRKCSVEPELGLLGINCNNLFFCVDMGTKKVLFEEKAHGCHSHHWVNYNDQKYISLQTAKNVMKMYRFDETNKSLTEDESLRLQVAENEEINSSEFDQKFEHIFIVKNLEVIEKRSVGELGKAMLSIKLQEKVGTDTTKLLTLSDDGTFCAIGGGGV